MAANDYKKSGVNIEKGYQAVSLIKKHAQKTMSKYVLNSLGSFAGMVSLPSGYKQPVLVSGTDGVGTKIEIACRYKKFDTVGIDCVAMCVNDVLCHGARPLFFLDYIACGKLDPKVAEQLVKGISDGCLMSDCSLIGGETAEMPGVYDIGKYDLAGFCVGIVEKNKIINGKNIKPKDALIGISSSGFHSNGYSLVRKMFSSKMNQLWKKLLTPTKIYVKPVLELLKKYEIKGMSHITGGGFIENVPRMLNNSKLKCVINLNSYKPDPIFDLLDKNKKDFDQYYNIFNMGIGFVLCVNQKDVKKIIADLAKMKEKAYLIGSIETKKLNESNIQLIRK